MVMAPHQQRGAALLVSLVMLIILTLLSVSAINMSTVNLRIVENMRAQQENDAAVDQAIQTALGNATSFPGLTNSDTNGYEVAVDDRVITVSARTCLGIDPDFDITKVQEMSERSGSVDLPEHSVWDFSASYTDPVTGAATTAHQGITIYLPSGNCPAPGS